MASPERLYVVSAPDLGYKEKLRGRDHDHALVRFMSAQMDVGDVLTVTVDGVVHNGFYREARIYMASREPDNGAWGGFDLLERRVRLE